MHRGRMHFLDAMNTVGRDDEAIIRDLWETPPVLPRESNGHHLFLPAGFQRVNQVGRLAAGAEDHRDVVRLGLQPELIDVETAEIEIVADRGHGRDIGHERDGGESQALFNDRMIEFDRDVERVTEAAAIAGYEKSSPVLEAA